MLFFFSFSFCSLNPTLLYANAHAFSSFGLIGGPVFHFVHSCMEVRTHTNAYCLARTDNEQVSRLQWDCELNAVTTDKHLYVFLPVKTRFCL